jgi:hypothetical protein
MPITVSGTEITFNDATTQTTAFTGGGGTVTSVATGNGLQGGTITTSGTLSIAAPGYNTVGSYVCAGITCSGTSPITNTNYSAGGGVLQMQAGAIGGENSEAMSIARNSNNLSGTWRWMSATNGNTSINFIVGLGCRVS